MTSKKVKAPKAERKALSKRLRFEVLKRDGFRCRYCGVTAMACALAVDHVVPVSKGGTDDPANLVASCVDCNGGKSNVELGDKRLVEADDPIGRALEHADQIREYLLAVSAVEAERARVSEWLADQYRDLVGMDPPKVLFQRFRGLAAQHPIPTLLAAMEAVGRAKHKLHDHNAESAYFHGCLRRLTTEVAA